MIIIYTTNNNTIKIILKKKKALKLNTHVCEGVRLGCDGGVYSDL